MIHALTGHHNQQAYITWTSSKSMHLLLSCQSSLPVTCLERQHREATSIMLVLCRHPLTSIMLVSCPHRSSWSHAAVHFTCFSPMPATPPPLHVIYCWTHTLGQVNQPLLQQPPTTTKICHCSCFHTLGVTHWVPHHPHTECHTFPFEGVEEQDESQKAIKTYCHALCNGRLESSLCTITHA